jgi:hypothetical protein
MEKIQMSKEKGGGEGERRKTSQMSNEEKRRKGMKGKGKLEKKGEKDAEVRNCPSYFYFCSTIIFWLQNILRKQLNKNAQNLLKP